jgi:hypothetical protein
MSLLISQKGIDEGEKYLMEYYHARHPAGYGIKTNYYFLDLDAKLAIGWSYSNYKNRLRRDHKVRICRLDSLDTLMDVIPHSIGFLNSRMYICKIKSLGEEDSKRFYNLRKTAYEKNARAWDNLGKTIEETKTPEIKDSEVSALAHAFTYHLLGQEKYANAPFTLVKYRDLFAKPRK